MSKFVPVSQNTERNNTHASGPARCLDRSSSEIKVWYNNHLLLRIPLNTYRAKSF
jgi:hypothetical protein